MALQGGQQITAHSMPNKDLQHQALHLKSFMRAARLLLINFIRPDSLSMQSGVLEGQTWHARCGKIMCYIPPECGDNPFQIWIIIKPDLEALLPARLHFMRMACFSAQKKVLTLHSSEPLSTK